MRGRGAFDQRLVGSRLDGNGLSEQTVEDLAAAERFAAVERESELIEIGIQMLQAHCSLMGPSSQRFSSATAR